MERVFGSSDIVQAISAFLPLKEVGRLQRVSKTFRNALRKDIVWQRFGADSYDDFRKQFDKLTKAKQDHCLYFQTLAAVVIHVVIHPAHYRRILREASIFEQLKYKSVYGEISHFAEHPETKKIGKREKETVRNKSLKVDKLNHITYNESFLIFVRLFRCFQS